MCKANNEVLEGTSSLECAQCGKLEKRHSGQPNPRLELPPFNLECVHRSFTFLGSKLWNALPPMIRASKDIFLLGGLLKCA